MPKPMSLSHRQWRKLRVKRLTVAKANGEPCWICGQAIDYDSPPGTPGSPTVDHLDPRAHGHPVLAPLHRLAPAHSYCNSSRGDGTKPRRARRRQVLRRSEDW